jgi:hypothetical protein
MVRKWNWLVTLPAASLVTESSSCSWSGLLTTVPVKEVVPSEPRVVFDELVISTSNLYESRLSSAFEAVRKASPAVAPPVPPGLPEVPAGAAVAGASGVPELVPVDCPGDEGGDEECRRDGARANHAVLPIHEAPRNGAVRATLRECLPLGEGRRARPATEGRRDPGQKAGRRLKNERWRRIAWRRSSVEVSRLADEGIGLPNRARGVVDELGLGIAPAFAEAVAGRRREGFGWRATRPAPGGTRGRARPASGRRPTGQCVRTRSEAILQAFGAAALTRPSGDRRDHDDRVDQHDDPGKLSHGCSSVALGQLRGDRFRPCRREPRSHARLAGGCQTAGARRSAMASRWAGRVPQQPPTSRAPAARMAMTVSA